MTRNEMESAIQGLMLLGRTREEAEREIHQNEDRKDREMEDEWWKDNT